MDAVYVTPDLGPDPARWANDPSPGAGAGKGLQTAPTSHAEIKRNWNAAYGEAVGNRLEADRRYSIVRVGRLVLAFSDYEGYVAALRDAWDSGLIAEPGPADVLGWELPAAVPELHAVDPVVGLAGPPTAD